MSRPLLRTSRHRIIECKLRFGNIGAGNPYNTHTHDVICFTNPCFAMDRQNITHTCVLCFSGSQYDTCDLPNCMFLLLHLFGEMASVLFANVFYVFVFIPRRSLRDNMAGWWNKGDHDDRLHSKLHDSHKMRSGWFTLGKPDDAQDETNTTCLHHCNCKLEGQVPATWEEIQHCASVALILICDTLCSGS